MNFIGVSSYWFICILYLLGHASAAPCLMAGEVGGWNRLTSSSALCTLFFSALGGKTVTVVWEWTMRRSAVPSITFMTCFKACAGQSVICKWTKETVQDNNIQIIIFVLSCPSSWSLEIYSFYLQTYHLKMFSRERDYSLIIFLAGFEFCKNECSVQQFSPLERHTYFSCLHF